MREKTTKKRRAGTGLPPPGILDAWHARGYVTPTEAAELSGFARTSMYGWINRKALVSREQGRAAVMKEGAFVWILRSAVIEKRDGYMPPADAVAETPAEKAS